MTDTAAARAWPPDPADEAHDEASTPPRAADLFPPAAHTLSIGSSREPAVSPSRTAVLDSVPPLGFLGESPSMSFGASQPSAAEPPPFGFNAPATRPPVPDPPGVVIPPVPRRALPPRELMPSVEPVRRNRLGESPMPTFGPPGRERSTAAMVALSIVTLGIYAVAWHRRVNQEMGDFDPRIHVHPARSAWAVVVPLLVGLLGTAAAGALIALDHFGVALDIPVTAKQAYLGLAAIAVVPYLVLFLPFSLVAVAMTAERVRVVEDHAGLTTDEQLRPASLVGWLLFPVIGGFVVMARQQRSLNRIWRLARA
jgi:hypothetical protein